MTCAALLQRKKKRKKGSTGAQAEGQKAKRHKGAGGEGVLKRKKKKKKSTEAVGEGQLVHAVDSGSQPEAAAAAEPTAADAAAAANAAPHANAAASAAASAAAAQAEADAEVDEEAAEALLLWGSKQKRKRVRRASSAMQHDLPAQAATTSPQRLLTSYFSISSPFSNVSASAPTAAAAAPAAAPAIGSGLGSAGMRLLAAEKGTGNGNLGYSTDCDIMGNAVPRESGYSTDCDIMGTAVPRKSGAWGDGPLNGVDTSSHRGAPTSNGGGPSPNRGDSSPRRVDSCRLDGRSLEPVGKAADHQLDKNESPQRGDHATGRLSLIPEQMLESTVGCAEQLTPVSAVITHVLVSVSCLLIDSSCAC